MNVDPAKFVQSVVRYLSDRAKEEENESSESDDFEAGRASAFREAERVLALVSDLIAGLPEPGFAKPLSLAGRADNIREAHS